MDEITVTDNIKRLISYYYGRNAFVSLNDNYYNISIYYLNYKENLEDILPCIVDNSSEFYDYGTGDYYEHRILISDLNIEILTMDETEFILWLKLQ